MQAARKAEEEWRKGREVQEGNACMSSLHAVQKALEGRSGTTATINTVDEKQEQGKAAGSVLQTGPRGGPEFRREATRRGLLDRLGRSSNAYRGEDSFDGGENDVPVGCGALQDQIHPNDDYVGESNFGVVKGLKWQIPVFDGKTTS